MKANTIESAEAMLDALEDVEGEGSMGGEVLSETNLATFDAAVASLPPYCDDSVELDWIRAHPAMSRKSRYAALGVHEPIAVTEQDILSPPHGRAPSQTAAQALQHWVNTPDKFFDRVLTEQRKRMEDARKSKKTEECSDDLAKLQQMIDDVVRDRAVIAKKEAQEHASTIITIGK